MDERKKRNNPLHSKDAPQKKEKGRQSSWSEFLKARVSRRELMKAGGIAAVSLSTAGSLSPRVFGQAPAVIKGTKLSILQGTYFVPAAQDLYKKQAQEWGKARASPWPPTS